MAQEFVHRNILGKSVHRYGISASYGLDESGVREAIELGANYLFWSPSKKFLKTVIKDVVMKDRDRFMLATGPILGYFAGSVRRAAEKALRASGSEYLDVLQVFWAGIYSISSLRRKIFLPPIYIGSSAEGPYIPGIATFISRRYIPTCAL